MAKVILENIQVLTAGQDVTSDGNGRPMNVQVVNLLVTPEQSTALALAQVDGRLQLALRNPLDQIEKRPNAVRKEQLFLGNAGSSSSTPAALPAVGRPVTRTAPRQETKPPLASPAPAILAPPSPSEVMATPSTRPKKKFEVINGNKSEIILFDADTGTKEESGK
jgi:pilus assembly protein CpaB